MQKAEKDQAEYDEHMEQQQQEIDAANAALEEIRDDVGYHDLGEYEQEHADVYADIVFHEDMGESTAADIADGMRAMGFTEEEINEELTKSRNANSDGQAVAAGAGEEISADGPSNRPGSESQAEAAGQAESLILEGQTNEQAAAALAAEKSAAAEAAAANKAADAKAKADAEANDFRLAGSNRPADVAIAGGQAGLLDGSPETPQPKDKPSGTAEEGEPNLSAAKALIVEQKAATGNKAKEASVRKKARDLALKTPISDEKTVVALDVIATRLGMGDGGTKPLEFLPAKKQEYGADAGVSADDPLAGKKNTLRQGAVTALTSVSATLGGQRPKVRPYRRLRLLHRASRLLTLKALLHPRLPSR